MEVSQSILYDIADSLEADFKCFLHKKTFEVVTYLDEDQYPDMDPEDWKEEIEKILLIVKTISKLKTWILQKALV